MSKKEVWRDIPGYDGAYQISNCGRIRSWRWKEEQYAKEPRILLQHTKRPAASRRSSRRLYVKLTDGFGCAAEIAVIRIMAEVWLGGVPEGKAPYYKDGNAYNNSMENIGFATPERARRNRKQPSGKPRKIAKVDKDGAVLSVYRSAYHAAAENYLSQGAVLDRCHGRIRKEYAGAGFTFRFLEDVK